MIGNARAAVGTFALGQLALTLCAVILAAGQLAAQGPAPTPVKPDDRASAYYNFAMGHLYGELAGAYGNRGEYVNRAIDFYRQAMKIDPEASYIGEELAELYVQSGQFERATQQARDLIKLNPENAAAHKILARIYARQIGDPEQNQGKIDQAMLKSAMEEYKKIAEINPKDVESLSMLARLYRVSRDEANAEKTYRAILAADPNDDDALTGLAAVYADRGDLTSAIGMLKMAVDKNPDPRTVTTLAEFYEQDKQYANAADTWQMALPMTNDNLQVRRHLAINLLAANRLDPALKAFQDLAAEDPKNLELQMQLVEILIRKQDFAAAHTAINKAKVISNTPDVRFAEAGLLDTEGRPAEGVAIIQGLLADTRKVQYSDQERGQRIQFLETMGRMQRNSGKTADAVASFRQISELNTAAAPRVEVEVIETMVAGRDYKGAKQAADAALRRFQGDRLVMMEHAALMGQLGQYDAAISELKALPDASKDRDVLVQIAQIQEKAKKFVEERKTFDAIESLSTSDQERQALDFMRGAMYEHEKNFEAAEREFRKILARDPNSPGALNYLGYMFADRNIRLDEAQQMITKALELDPGNGAYLDSLGWVHFRMNKLDLAADELRQAVIKSGNDATVHDHLAEVYAKQGKIKEAIQQWEASVAQFKSAVPSEQDPEELAKVVKKLETAKVKVAEKK
jgi:tetratricopeptide (TPR) repeat protein